MIYLLGILLIPVTLMAIYQIIVVIRMKDE